MAAFFTDELDETRQRLYWALMEPLVTIEEWEYACHQALLGQEFYKVPLPRLMLDFVETYRRAQAESQKKAAEQQPKRREIREDLLNLEQLRQLQMGIWPEERDRLLKDPIPPYDQEAP